MPRPSVAAIATALLLLLTACKHEVDPPRGDITSALAAATTPDGATFDPAPLRGKPVIVMFWRVGCSYCMREMPIVAKVARAKGVEAVAVMVAGRLEKAQELARGFDGTMLVDNGVLRTQYDITKVPYTLVLRGDGTAARAFIGEQSESTLASAIDGAR